MSNPWDDDENSGKGCGWKAGESPERGGLSQSSWFRGDRRPEGPWEGFSRCALDESSLWTELCQVPTAAQALPNVIILGMTSELCKIGNRFRGQDPIS